MTSRSASCALAMLIIGVPIGSSAQTWDWENLTKPRPAFTIEISRQLSNGAGERLEWIEETLEAYKSDGSSLYATRSTYGTIVVHSVFSAQDESSTELHHDVKAKSTVYQAFFVWRTPAPPKDPTCETLADDTASYTESIIGKDEFLGLTVVKRLTQLENGNTYESWQAPDLGCKEIFVRDTRKICRPKPSMFRRYLQP